MGTVLLCTWNLHFGCVHYVSDKNARYIFTTTQRQQSGSEWSVHGIPSISKEFTRVYTVVHLHQAHCVVSSSIIVWSQVWSRRYRCFHILLRRILDCNMCDKSCPAYEQLRYIPASVCEWDAMVTRYNGLGWRFEVPSLHVVEFYSYESTVTVLLLI